MRVIAPAMAMLPSLLAGTELNTPLKLPIGVRTALAMTTCCFLFTGYVPVTPFEITLDPSPFAPRRVHDTTPELM
jgi:hypothetical protein